MVQGKWGRAHQRRGDRPRQSVGRSLQWVFLISVAIVPLLAGCALPQVQARDRIFLPLQIDFLSEYLLPKQTFQNTPVGGLSGITYDRQRGLLYAISDDRSNLAPARFYTLSLDLDRSTPNAPKIQAVTVQAVTPLRDETGAPYAKNQIDPEGIALTPQDTLLITSEGDAKQEIPPAIQEFDRTTGQWKRRLPLPQRYVPQSAEGKQTQGVADNLGFEALTLGGVSPGSIEPFRLFTATESALVQDQEPEEARPNASRNRWLHYTIDPDHALLVSEQLYVMEPPPPGAQYHGLVEIVAIDQGGHFLSLERSFGTEGLTVKLFQLSLGSATDIRNIDQLRGSLPAVQPIRKQLLLDLTQLGIQLDNLEGMTLGPQLPDGSRSLLLVSDDNFNPLQVTQFLLFRLRG